jgi:hypothetical protein
VAPENLVVISRVLMDSQIKHTGIVTLDRNRSVGVRSGAKTKVSARRLDICFASMSGHRQAARACPKLANRRDSGCTIDGMSRGRIPLSQYPRGQTTVTEIGYR